MNKMHDAIHEVLKGSGKSLVDLQGELCLTGEYAENPDYDLTKYKKDLSNMPVTLAYLVAGHLNLDFECLFYGHFDKELASMQLLGDTTTIPSRYDSYNGTFIKTVGNFLDFANSIYGEGYANCLRQRFQLTKEMIRKSPDTRVNGQLLMDLFEKLRNDGIEEEVFFGVGLNGARNFADKIVPKLTSLELSPKQLYEEIIYDLDKSVEQNLNYKIINAAEDKMLFTATIRPELALALKTNTFGTVAHSYNIMGWFSGFLEYLYDEQAMVKKLSCSYLGDDRCIYEIDYSSASQSGDDSSKILRMFQ